MPSIIIKGKILLEDLMDDPSFYLNAVQPRKKFLDGKATDEIVGYVYRATNIGNYEQVQVFVEQKTPLFDSEQLENLKAEGERVFVQFDKAVVKPYYSEKTRAIEDSIKADSVRQVKL